MTEEVKQESTLRDDIKSALKEVTEAPEAEMDDVETGEVAVPDEKLKAESRDDKGRFKPKEDAVEADAPVIEKLQEAIEDAPHSLSSVAKAKWAEVPAEVRKEIARLENERHRAFTAHDGELRMGREMKEVISPYMAIIQSEGGTPTTAVRDLLNTAYVLRTAPAMQKAQLIQQVCQQYGVDLNLLSQAQSTVDPSIQQLQQELAMLKQQANPDYIQKQLQERMEIDNINNEVKAFASDPANKHYETVKPIMASLLQSGASTNMKEAYEMACKAHPTISSMLAAELQPANKAKPKVDIEAKKKASSSITGSPSAVMPNSGSPNRTLREELMHNLRAFSS